MQKLGMFAGLAIILSSGLVGAESGRPYFRWSVRVESSPGSTVDFDLSATGGRHRDPHGLEVRGAADVESDATGWARLRNRSCALLAGGRRRAHRRHVLDRENQGVRTGPFEDIRERDRRRGHNFL